MAVLEIYNQYEPGVIESRSPWPTFLAISYLWESLLVDMIHHDNFIVKDSTRPSRAVGGMRQKPLRDTQSLINSEAQMEWWGRFGVPPSQLCLTSSHPSQNATVAGQTFCIVPHPSSYEFSQGKLVRNIKLGGGEKQQHYGRQVGTLPVQPQTPNLKISPNFVTKSYD